MAEQSTMVYGLLAASALVYLWRWVYPNKRQLSHIPAVGPTAPLLSYLGALRYTVNGMGMVTEGYQKYKGGLYKVANFDRWVVIISGPKLVEEFAKAADDELSFQNALDTEVPAIPFALGCNLASDDYFLKVIRTSLTNSLHTIFLDVQDELVISCNIYMPLSKDWVAVPTFDTVVQTIGHVIHRAFVGLPLCRDPKYVKLMSNLSVETVIAGHILTPFPDCMKSTAAKLLTRLPSTAAKCVKILKPEIEKRLENMKKFGNDYPDKPVDFLSWLIDGAEGEEREVANISLRIILVNFAAMHTIGIILTFALYHLAANPEYVRILRQEVEEVVSNEGWSRDSLGSLHKMDSFLKECLRMYSIASVNVLRQAAKDFTFSDGTFIPKGTQIKVAVLPMQRDSAFYENAETFNPWRFSDAREAEGGDSVKHTVVNIDIDYLTFGYGRHTCPGRWFAAAKLKLFLAHVVTTYDLKSEKDGVVPPPLTFGSVVVPNPKARVLFRKRQT